MFRPSTAMLLSFALVLDAHAADPLPRKHASLERLKLERLATVHADVEKLNRRRVVIPPRRGLTDFRCIMHAHAEDSSHTGGKLSEMLADATKARVNAILLTDHYRPPRDFIDGRWRGLKEGVLFIPGSEVNGFLIHPEKSILKRMELKGSDFIRTVTDGDGLILRLLARRDSVRWLGSRATAWSALESGPGRFVPRRSAGGASVARPG